MFICISEIADGCGRDFSWSIIRKAHFRLHRVFICQELNGPLYQHLVSSFSVDSVIVIHCCHDGDVTLSLLLSGYLLVSPKP